MVFVIVPFSRARMLEEQGVGTGVRSGIKIEIYVGLPANPNLHGANHSVRRAQRVFWQFVAGKPVGHLHVPRCAKHLNFGFSGIGSPMLRQGCNPGSMASKTLKYRWNI